MKNFSELSQLTLHNDTVIFEFSSDLPKSLKRFLVELKIQVDRWDLVTDNFVFHNDMSTIVKEFLSDDVWYNDRHKIWGADIHFTNDIAKDHAYAISSVVPEENVENRHIALGILPIGDLKKYYDLKAFW